MCAAEVCCQLGSTPKTAPTPVPQPHSPSELVLQRAAVDLGGVSSQHNLHVLLTDLQQGAADGNGSLLPHIFITH